MLDHAQQAGCCLDAVLRDALEQATRALDGAVSAISTNVEAACDDLIAARLLVNTALLKLDQRATP